MLIRSCYECKFFYRDPNWVGDDISPTPGVCKCFPPKKVKSSGRDTEYIKTVASEGCGHWQNDKDNRKKAIFRFGKDVTLNLGTNGIWPLAKEFFNQSKIPYTIEEYKDADGSQVIEITFEETLEVDGDGAEM